MLVRYKPSTLFSDLFEDDLFNALVRDVSVDSYSPAQDILETDVDYVINLMVPGLDKKDFKVQIDEDKLIVEGERRVDESVKFNLKQSYFGKFKKVYTLPKNVLQEKISAKYENGVLIVNVPKNVEMVKSMTIEVV